jgi:hypothetical protein
MKKTNRFKLHEQDGRHGIADHKKLRFYPFESLEQARIALGFIALGWVLQPRNTLVFKIGFYKLKPQPAAV